MTNSTQLSRIEWLPVPDPRFAESHEVSRDGKVRRVIRGATRGPGELKGFPMDRGYRQVRLTHKGVHQTFLVHRLVAAAFIGPCPDGQEVNHLDSDKSNNCVRNLEYVTRAENISHAHRSGRGRKGDVHGRSILSESLVAGLRLRWKAGESIRSLAREAGVSKTTMADALKGITWKCVPQEVA